MLDPEQSARIAEAFEDVNDDHMPPSSPYQDILGALSRVLMVILAVLIATLIVANLF